MSSGPGQIIPGTPLGDKLSELCQREDIHSVLEVGAWNGNGSTKIILDAIKKRTHVRFSGIVISLEADRFMYECALKNLGKQPEWFKLINGSICSALVDFNALDDSYFQDYPRDVKRTWFDYERKISAESQCVLPIIPSTIDVVFLDGGEFTTWHEFVIVQSRCKHLLVDDTNQIKGRQIRTVLRNATDWILHNDCPNDRNGWLYAEKIK